MGDVCVEDEDAVEEEDAGNWWPRAAVITTPAASSPAKRSQRIRRVGVRAWSLWLMPPVKAAWRCRHVCGFRYAGDMRQPVSLGACVC